MRKVLFFTFTLVIMSAVSSCNKEVTEFLAQPTGIDVDKAREYVRNQIDQTGGFVQTFEVNKRMPMAFIDMQGNRVYPPQLPGDTRKELLSGCTFEYPDYIELIAYSRYYTCGVGYKIQFNWIISWNNNVVIANPYNTYNKTTGTVRISIPGNSTAFNHVTEDVQIWDLGTDPDNSANKRFLVEMTSTELIPWDFIDYPDATLRIGATFASDCTTMEFYPLIPMEPGIFGFEAPLNSDPCTRNDKAWFVPPGAASGSQFGVWGYDPLSSCPSYDAGYGPDFQMVDYSLDGGVTWEGFKNTTATSYVNILNDRFVRKFDLALSKPLPSGTYSVIIRYANIQANIDFEPGEKPDSGNSCANGGWGTEAFTYETFDDIIIP